jgi:hypothetical protein
VPRVLTSRSHQLYIGHAVRSDYSSPGRTGSTSTTPCATSTRRASGHSVSRHNYSSSGLHWLYCAYVVHPDASSRRSTSRRSLALALAVRPVTTSRGATTHRLDCTGSTAPMLCIRTRRLDARLLVTRLHWLSPCARSFRCAS